MAKLSKKLRFRVLERAGFKCHYCGRKPPDVELHVDHVEAEALGGNSTEANLVAACADCNHGKSDDILEPHWLQRIREALGRCPVVEIEFYCPSSDCACREVTLRIKDYDDSFAGLIKTRGKARCPVCSQHLTLHSVLTAEEVQQRDEKEARCSVNEQIQRRASGTMLISAALMLDDSLPAALGHMGGDTHAE